MKDYISISRSSINMDSFERNNMSSIEELLNLIKEGESERVKEILESSFLYHKTDASGATILHYAAEYNDAILTKYLLNKGCDVNIQDANGTTPLMIAVTKNHEAIMKMLLTTEADIFVLNHEKISALHMLSTQYLMKFRIIVLFLQTLQKKCSSSEEVAQKLIDAGCHIYQATLLQDANVIQIMAEQGIPVNYASPIKKITAVHFAVILDDLKSLQVLVKYGADPNVLDAGNENPLHNLYKQYPRHSCDKIEILKILINHGTSMTSCTQNGFFHANTVLRKGNRQAVRLLLEAGLDCKVKDDKSHCTVLHCLATNQDPEVAAELELHAAKFDIDICDKFGQTALLIAVLEGNVSMVKFLLKQGASTEIKRSMFNNTPLYYAYEHRKPGLEKQYHQCGELLLEYNANAQYVGMNRNRETLTIFDAALKKNNFNQIKPAIAQLAIHDKLGKPITEIIWSKIDSNHLLKNYFHKCQRLLAEKFSGRVELFDLLTVKEQKMARYLNNKNIVRKIRDKRYRCKMLHYRFYYNILRKRYSKGQYYKTLRNEAAGIICKLFDNQINETYIIINIIIDYLNQQSLEHLCQTFH